MKFTRKVLLKIVKSKIALGIILRFNSFIRKLAGFSHFCQYVSEWYGTNTAEWFDHNIDQYCLWHKLQNPMGNERGIFNLTCIKQNADILELCSGDGFNAFYFYASRAKSIDSIDLDRNAVKRAEKNYGNRGKININFLCGDICKNIPEKKYDNVIWDAAIEHFTPDDAVKIINDVKKRLKENGILSGYTIVEQKGGKRSLEEHEYEYKSKNELFEFLIQFFKYVVVFETIYTERHNLYFFASDTKLPIHENILTNSSPQ